MPSSRGVTLNIYIHTYNKMWNKLVKIKKHRNNIQKPIFSQLAIASGHLINITDHIKKKCLANKWTRLQGKAVWTNKNRARLFIITTGHFLCHSDCKWESNQLTLVTLASNINRKSNENTENHRERATTVHR